MPHSFFAGKHILITGATGGLGSALVKQLSEPAGLLVLHARSSSRLEQLADSLPNGTRVITITADLSVPGEAARLADQALVEAGHLDLVFNNAGLGYFALIEEAEEAKIRYLFEVNTFAPLLLMQTLLPTMIIRGTGRIVNIVSSAGRVPIPTVGVYGGSKSALAVMANTMRLELEPKGIEVVNIYPGTVNSSFERNAMREAARPGLCPTVDCGAAEEEIANQIIHAAAGPAGEVWLERTGRLLALAAIAWPTVVDNRLKHLRDKTLSQTNRLKPQEFRRWRLWQLESTIACNLRCIMCPWEGVRRCAPNGGHMGEEVWQALLPYLGDVKSIDFTGGGEPLLQPNLLTWIRQAKAAGCDAGFLTNGLLLNDAMIDALLDTGMNWIGFSIDGADKTTYEAIRKGADFDRVCANIKTLTSRRIDRRPLVMINFVIMSMNQHQLETIIECAAQLGADQVNFKQCDVIRGEHGAAFGLFADKETKQIRHLEKALKKATRLARKRGIRTTSFSFTPEELPVCDQDPRDSLFIRHDGSVAPCINLAIGGPSRFFGKKITFPTVHYGRLPETDLESLWHSETCTFYRRRFEQRVNAHDQTLSNADIGRDLIKMKEAFQAAIEAMPQAPEGCRHCHYLYDV
ncbi:SDR family NAD(P)-dependent oxidoreductase [Desulfofustis glycolicus]|uniref:Short-chain dehydrogenase n=1 Tax=Desulfofustis glycolicus DSM 9705 TaxID=1121409 RepID=A0A1M5S8J5_9BACT|nr:SDR family NAD(P)-dependent oxidoreductase [Desulfofustis glycolicus]MCB2216209.1 SDR family NAD(P)-dependent oxidoreductase [Desulfobulbaceae bacterium]SHH34814.1 Short-chain dehydrogenase [Desulfofustis glycolicus DSM 9705]